MNVMDLVAKISLDSSDYESGIGEAKSKFSGLGGFLKDGVSALGSVTASAMKATTAAIGGAVAGIATLTKASFDSYAEYQQLTGGIETMFEDLSYDVQENARQAYLTTGMTTNEYLDTVMGFSASLNQSLMANEGNIARAAEVSDQIITDMADNASKMGTNMESIQNAYAGFAKQNYTMLDNLKLGYGGTKEEMERLLEDAEALTGKEYDVSNFADIAEAIHVIQEEMGIAGNAAEEASGTISGSFGALSASWQNLVMGFSDPDADIGQLISNVVETGKTALSNAIPVITQALSGIGTALGELIPAISEELPGLIQELLPQILTAATSLVDTLASNLPDLLDVIVQQIPAVLPSVINATVALISAIAGQLPQIFSIVTDVLVEEVPKIISQLQSNIGKFTSGLTSILKSIGDLILKLAPVILPAMISLAVELIKSLAQGFTENADEVINAVFEMVNLLVEELTNPDTLMSLLECGLAILTAVVTGISNNLPVLLDGVILLVTNLAQFLLEAVPELVKAIGENGAEIVTEVLPTIILTVGEAVADLLKNIGDWIGQGVFDLQQKAEELFDAIPAALADLWDSFSGDITKFVEDAIAWFADKFLAIKQVGTDLVEGLWNGINDAKEWVLDKIEGFGDAVLDGLKSFFGIASPSKKTAIFGQYLAEGLAVGFDEEADATFDSMQDALDKGMDGLTMNPIGIDALGSVNVRGTGGSGSDSTASILGKIYDMLMMIANQETTLVFPVSIGNEPIEEIIFDAKRNVLVKSGGQVDL